MKTKESLGIYWTFESKDEKGQVKKFQDEVDGLIFYGYWDKNFSNIAILDSISFVSIWGCDADVQIHTRNWSGESNCNYSIDVCLKAWPNEQKWFERVEKALRWFTHRGAILTWCGTELCSPSLDVFDPENASGSIYAAYNTDVGFICNSSLSDEYEELSPQQLIKFRKYLN
jgi:hypothetical protein